MNFPDRVREVGLSECGLLRLGHDGTGARGSIELWHPKRNGVRARLKFDLRTINLFRQNPELPESPFHLFPGVVQARCGRFTRYAYSFEKMRPSFAKYQRLVHFSPGKRD